MNDVKEIINQAATKDDRWLFVALLVIVLLAVVGLWRWLTSDRDKVATRLTEITDRHISQSEHLSTVVTNNTLALQQNTEALRRVELVMDHCKLTIQKTP